MGPFRHLLHDHRLWTVRRRNVVPAFALGLFLAFLPIPGHMLVAILLALALSINIPAAAIGTLIVNPLTVAPLYFLCYELGVLLLGLEPQEFEFEFSFGWLSNQFADIWQPLLLGCFVIGTITAIVGYVALDYFWRESIADYLAKRRDKRGDR